MRVWVIYIYEAVAEVDAGVHTSRYGALCEALSTAGHSVRWFQSTFAHVARKHRFDATTEKVLSNGVVVSFVHGPGYARSASLVRVWHNKVVAKRMAKLMDESDASPDLIIAGLPAVETVAAAAKYARRHNIPLVVDAHDQWPEIYLKMFPAAVRSLGRVLLSREFASARKSFRTAAAFTAVSQTYLDWICRFSGLPPREKDRVFPLGYQLPRMTDSEVAERFTALRQRYSLPDEALRAIFVGSFGRFYDVETIVKAARLSSAGDQAVTQFVLVGDGDRMAEVRRRAAGLTNVVLTGWLDQRDAYALLVNSSVGISAYTSDATQSLPYKPFEYMAAGLIQVCSLRGEVQNLLRIEGVGRPYIAGDPSSLLRAIESLRFDCDPGSAARRKARQLFEKRYDMRQIYRDFAQLLVEIAGRAAHADKTDARFGR